MFGMIYWKEKEREKYKEIGRGCNVPRIFFFRKFWCIVYAFSKKKSKRREIEKVIL